MFYYYFIFYFVLLFFTRFSHQNSRNTTLLILVQIQTRGLCGSRPVHVTLRGLPHSLTKFTNRKFQPRFFGLNERSPFFKNTNMQKTIKTSNSKIYLIFLDIKRYTSPRLCWNLTSFMQNKNKKQQFLDFS